MRETKELEWLGLGIFEIIEYFPQSCLDARVPEEHEVRQSIYEGTWECSRNYFFKDID